MRTDFRKPLFELEQWSPRLARRFWAWTSILELPPVVALNLRVKEISDDNVEVEIPLNRLTGDRDGRLHTSTLITAGEFTAKLLWKRHILLNSEEVFLNAIHGTFMKKPTSKTKVKTHLAEMERERILRKLRTGQEGEVEMPIIYIDSKGQQVASVNFIFSLRPRRQFTLSAGKGENR